MPLPVAHGLVGAAVVAALHPRPLRLRRLPLVIGGALANCADADFLLVWWFGSKAWHRGFTHSFAFAAALALVAFAVWGRSHFREALAYCLAYASHGALDFLTTKAGGGVELWWPLTPARYGLRLWGLSELPSQLTPAEVTAWLLLELLIFAPPLLLVLLLRRRLKSQAGAPPQASK
jgi:membrane-bound metal-dependent hydrolase YbcI (DUF457 family)